MKKIIKGIANFFKSIYHVIDRFIITPISRLIFNISEFLKNHNIRLDYILSRPRFMIYVSLILSVAVFIFIDTKAINLVESEAEILPNIPVEVKYNEEAYVVEGLPESVDIVLMGRKSDIYLAKQLGNNTVVLDLSDYEARDYAYKVYLTYNKSINSIDYKLDPSYVSVTIKEKISENKVISYDLINEKKLAEKLSVKSVDLSSTEVAVKGSKEAIDKIANVKALIDLDNEQLSDVGSYEIDTIPVIAYDSRGHVMENIEIVPKTIKATITLDTYSKSVPIQVKTTGKLVTGRAIASILINNSNSHSVTIYGEQELVNNISNVPVTINVDDQGASATKAYDVKIYKPTGVRAISDKKASITVTFGDERQKELTVTTVGCENLASGYTANIIGNEGINVIVKGVQSVIDNVSRDSITAYVDLTDRKEGEHEVQVKIKNDDPRLNFVVSSSVKVRIIKN